MMIVEDKSKVNPTLSRARSASDGFRYFSFLDSDQDPRKHVIVEWDHVKRTDH